MTNAWLIWVQTDRIEEMSLSEARAQLAAGRGLWRGPFLTLKSAQKAAGKTGNPSPSPAPGKKPVISVSGAQIASDAQRYAGVPYVFGGNTPSGWDCSGFVTWVLRHDLKFKILAPRPVVMTYVTWAQAKTIPFSEAEAGDLCCWAGIGANGHIGIAISGTQMISALNPADGTKVTPILGTGPSSAPFMVRRVTGLSGAAGLSGCASAIPGAGAAMIGVLWTTSLHRKR